MLLSVLIFASPFSPFSGKQSETTITFSDKGLNIAGGSLSYSDVLSQYHKNKTLLIDREGKYRISGTLKNSQILVDWNDSLKNSTEKPIEIILDNVIITGASMPAIKLNRDTIITLAEDSNNEISAGNNNAIYSTGSIIFQGEGKDNGKLLINTEKNGIRSSADLTFESGTYVINAFKNCFSANDKIYINGGNLIAGGMGDELSNIESRQHFMQLIFQPEKTAGSAIVIHESQGNDILNFDSTGKYMSLFYSSPEIKEGIPYEVYFGNIPQQHSVQPVYNNTEIKAVPHDLDEWLKKSDIPEDIRAWIEQEAKGQQSSEFIVEGNGTTFYHVKNRDERGDPQAEWPFKDVSPKKWYFEGVQYVYEKGLMKGISDNSFAPGKKLNRAMLVTILHRIEGTPVSIASSGYSDVASGKWYTEAIAWAKENDIVTGYTANKFGPKEPVTREQLLSILYRYAEYKGCDVSIKTNDDFSSFKDQSRVASYAKKPVQWALSQGLIGGRNNAALAPKAEASRSEVSVILMRFLENNVY